MVGVFAAHVQVFQIYSFESRPYLAYFGGAGQGFPQGEGQKPAYRAVPPLQIRVHEPDNFSGIVDFGKPFHRPAFCVGFYFAPQIFVGGVQPFPCGGPILSAIVDFLRYAAVRKPKLPDANTLVWRGHCKPKK
jgi:hypothetical protein